MQLSFVLLEQPEDLGAMACGPHAGERPASMWQWPAFADITAKPGWKTFVFHQGNFGAGYPKPTRLLVFAKESFKLPSFCYVGPPVFDDKGFYLGPLPMAKGMGSIRNRQSQGPFKTSRTEMRPTKMRQWISSMLLSSGTLCYDSFKGCARYDTQSREENKTSRETAEELADTFLRALESWVALGRRESATCQGVRETSMTEGDSARQGGGPLIGGIWRIVTAGFSRKQLEGRAASMS